MYDYNNGRFLSVDPFIQSPTSTQSMNPYTYIFNNPLSGIDPTGYISDQGPCGPNDYACQWDQSMASVLGVSRDEITEMYNGIRDQKQRSNNSNASDVGNQTSEFMKEYAKGELKKCEGGVGCPDWYMKANKELAFGAIKYPSDSILLPESPDDNGVRVRVSPSTGLIYWETPRGEVSVQGLKQFLDDGVKNGVIFVALSALGITGRTGGTNNVKTTPVARGAANPKIQAALRKGQQAHKDRQYPAGYEKEVRLPSGKRMDAYNKETKHVIELKPNNTRAKKQGEKQVQGYCNECDKVNGKGHTGTVETYD